MGHTRSSVRPTTNHAWERTIAGMRYGIKHRGFRTDTGHMHARRTSQKPSVLDRVLAALPGRRAEVEVLVLVNTTRGPIAVPVKHKLR
jgi:hypothetical protein